MATSITLNSSSYQGRYLSLTCVQTKNIADNTSTINWTLTATGGTSSYYSTGATTVKINGTQVYYCDRKSYSTQAFPAAKGSTSGTITVNHNSSGEASISVSLATAIYTSTISTVSDTWTLDSIPRESTISATSCNVGGSSSISVTRKNSSYTHSIAYSFKGLSGYITSVGGTSSSESKYSTTSIAFVIPSTFASAMGSSTSATCTLTIKTYSGSTQIGSAKTCTFSVSTSSSSSAPSVSGSVVDTNSKTTALTGNSSTLVKYYSTAECTISATAKDGATITDKKINGTSVSGTTRTITNVETNSFLFYAQDSRGYSDTATIITPMVNYVKLTNNATAERTTATGSTVALKLSGNYFNGSFGTTSNTLTVKYRYKTSSGSYNSYKTVTATKSGNTYSYTANLSGFPYTTNYTFEVVVSDKLASVTKTFDLGLGVPIFDWGESDFRFNVPVTMSEPLEWSSGGTGLDTVTAGGVLVGAIGGFTMTSAGTEGQVLTSNGLNPPTWEDAGGGSGGGNTIGCIRVKCSSTSNLTISTSTSWGDIEIPFDTVVFNYGEGLSLDSSSWHSIDCSENGYLEITGSAYFSGTSAYNKYMSLHLVSGNNTELISVKRSAMSGAMIIGPYIVPYSSSMRYFTLCARSDATSPYIDLDNAATWFQVKYIAYT